METFIFTLSSLHDQYFLEKNQHCLLTRMNISDSKDLLLTKCQGYFSGWKYEYTMNMTLLYHFIYNWLFGRIFDSPN